MESAITIKGQATIPKPIREHVGLQPGDRVKFFVHPDGSVDSLPKLPASAIRARNQSARRGGATVRPTETPAFEKTQLAGIANGTRTPSRPDLLAYRERRD